MLHRMLVMTALLLLPSAAFASVQINEIAWMGTPISTANEWIELHNTDANEVSLSGWKIVSPTSKLSITLKGTIAPDGYYLIERTDDDTVSGIPADLIATFSLLNDGMTLQLVDATGTTIDEVVGGTSWKNIGGDVTTKDTPQRTASGWVTATPTPRAPTVATADTPTTDTSGASDTIDPMATSSSGTMSDITVDKSQSSSSSSANSQAVAAKKVVTRESYRITVHSSERIYKDIPTTLRASVTGLHDEPLPGATIIWNLGDGTTASGAEVVHSYHFSGTYPVVVTASYAGLSANIRAKAVVIAQDVHIANALPGIDGFVSIVSPVDIDLSGWSLRDGATSFVFPPQTELIGKVPTLFPNNITGMYVQQTLALHRSDGHLMSAVENSMDQELSRTDYPSENLSLARSATLPPVLTKPATTTATSFGDWALANAEKTSRFPVWGYWVLAAFFVAATGTIVILSSAFDPKHDADSEAAKYTYIELDSNLEDIT